MYGHGVSFNPHYRHGAPPPQAGLTGSSPQQPKPTPPPQQQQQAGVTGPFPQQPQLPPPPPQQQQQAGVTGPFPQQPVPLPPASYPQHPVGHPLPGAYPHSTTHFQNPAYPFAQHGQMHQVPMGTQQRSFSPMPMSGPPPPQAMYQGPHYPMAGPLPPPPPRPPSFAAPPPPPPPSSPPPLPPAPPTSIDAQSCSAEGEGKQVVHGAADGAKTEKAETQLIASDDSDMDMDGDEESPSRKHVTIDNTLLVTAECAGDVNASKSLSGVSRPGNDLQAGGSNENAKTANVTVEGGSPFRLIQGYSSDDNEEVDAGSASRLVTSSKDNGHSYLSDRNNEIVYQKLATAKANVNTSHGTEQDGDARKYHLKDESNPVKQDTDVRGHLVEDDLWDSEFDGVRSSKSHGGGQRKRSRSKSPKGRSFSPVGAKRGSPSQSFSPGRQSTSPLAKRVHPTEEGEDTGPVQKKGKDTGHRIDMQEGLLGTEKLDGALGQNNCNDNLTCESSRSVAVSANASDPHKQQRSCSQSESRSMGLDVPQAHPQSLCPPEHMSSGVTQAHQVSSNMIRSSEYPETQFQQNFIAPANEFLQNEMRTYRAPDPSHPRPLSLHDHTLQPVASHQQPAAIHVENAPVSHPDRWSNYPGGIGLAYSSHPPPYGQQQPAGCLDSGNNFVYPSFQRFAPNLPGSSDHGPVDVGLHKSSIKLHYNPFASTFEQTDPSLGIDPAVSPNAAGSFSTKAVEHTNTLPPFGQSFPGSGSHAHENSAEAVRNRQKQKQFCLEFTSGAPYDPLIDSIEPSSSSINKVDPGKEKHRSADDGRDPSKFMNIEVDSKDTLGLGVVAESDVEGLGEVAADTEAGVVENGSPEFLGAKDWNSDIPGDMDNDQSLSKRAKDSRSTKLFKNAIADFVKEVLKPSWRQGNMSKEAFKTIVKKTVDKVSSSVPSSHIPKTPAKIKQYLQSSQRKVTKLVMGYVDKYVKS